MGTRNASNYSFEQLDVSGDAERAPADVLAAAWADAAKIRERAYAEGESAGYAAGLERAESEFKPIADGLVNALGEAATELALTRAQLVEQLTHQAAEVSLRIGEQIVAGAVAFQPELIIDVTRGAVRRLAERHRVTVLVNPDDLELVSASIDQLRAEMGGIEYMDVQADRRVGPGGVIVQTDYGEIDATVETQLQNARGLVSASLVGDTSRYGFDGGADDAV